MGDSLKLGGSAEPGGEEEFVGAAGVFDARPDVVAGAELEEGFEEVAVLFAGVGEGLGAAPEERGGPVAVRCHAVGVSCGAEGAVVHDGCGLALLVFVG